MQKFLWGIDLGGTKIEGIVLNAENFAVLARPRVDTEAHLGYDHIISQIEKLVNLLKEQTGLKPTAIGFSTPGTLDPGLQSMKNCNTTALNGENLQKDLEERLQVKVILANDANCFALAETQMGAVKDHMPNAKVVFGVILGSGVGGGVVVNSQVIGGRHGIGGEWGHNTLDADGPDCYCGKKGCNETIFSGPRLEDYYERLSGTRLKLKDIYENHKAGVDPMATMTMDRLTSSFGKAIQYVLNLIDPDVVVIGGGVGNIDLVYSEGVEAAKAHIFNNRKIETLFLKPKLGDSAGVYGAAELTRSYV